MIFGILAALLYFSIIIDGLSKVPVIEILLYFPLLEARTFILTASLANKTFRLSNASPELGTINLKT